MKRTNSRVNSNGLAFALIGVLALGSVAAALQAAPTCDPEPINVLMLVGGPAHDFEELPLKLAEKLGVDGDVRTRVTHEIKDFNQANLADVDVMMFNCCIKEMPPESVRRAIIAALADGKGLVAMHCAFWCFQQWPEWREIVGGIFEVHDKYGPVEAVVVDGQNPILQGVPNRFMFEDEAYVVVERSENERALVNGVKTHGGHPTPEALVWTKRYLGSRIFAIMFGHDAKSQLDPVFLMMLRNGIRWSDGRLAPATMLNEIERKDGFTPLFDGKTLAGWKYDPKYWTVADGQIVGNTHPDGLTEKTYAITEKSFGDFVLRFDVKLTGGNSGVQFRSKALPNYQVAGYQADAAPKAWGNLHEQNGRRKLVNGWAGKGKQNVDPDGWNEMEVIASGRHVRIKLNGVKTAEWAETQRDIPRTGIIALQLHDGGPMEVRYTNIRIKPLITKTK